ncbi:hypothetical protein Hanom_Chr09g00848971 [Helianthus anomalus]
MRTKILIYIFKFFIDSAKLLPLARFLPQPKYVLFVVILIFLHLGVFTVGRF